MSNLPWHEWQPADAQGRQTCARCGAVRVLGEVGLRGYRLMYRRADVALEAWQLDEPPCAESGDQHGS